MSKKIGLIFATRNAIQPALEAFARYAPEAELELYMDEGLLPAVRKAGGVTAPLLRRFASLVARAEESGADGILFSCTVFSPSLAELEPFFAVPVVSVDGAMLAEAAAQGGTVGVVATVETTERMVVEQLGKLAKELGTELTIHSRVVPEAFAVLPSDPGRHDALIFEAARGLAAKCDRLLLAQMSMARAAEQVAVLGKPVLTSLESSVNAIMRKIN